MLYESHGIQSQGGLFEITTQEPVVTGKHRQGKRGKSRKARPKSNCDHCGVEFEVKPRSAGQFCSHQCMFEFRKNSLPAWANCYQCLALVGIGMTVASRLLNQDKATLHRTKRKMGFVTNLTSRLGWKHSVRDSMQWWIGCEKEWMEGYKVKFPDWSSIASKEKNAKRCREYQREKHRSSAKGSDFRLKKTIRSRIYNGIKRSINGKRPRMQSRTTELIGCSISHLKAHLEQKFKPGMTWENHGSGWHIDHIVPLSSFDLQNDSHLMIANHFSNLAPLWANENLSKADKMPENHQTSLPLGL